MDRTIVQVGGVVQQPQTAVTSRGSLARLLDVIRDTGGADLSLYRPRYVERRIGTRLQSLGLVTYRQYASRLREDPEEYDRLMSALTINVTQFFRDPSTFDAFSRLAIPELVARSASGRGRTIRAWSAGCATGQEAYSIAMCLADAGAVTDRGVVASVLGTDVDEAALRTARSATYDVRELEDIPAGPRQRYTERHGDAFAVAGQAASICRFSHASLFDASARRAFDVVLCRNVFIYLPRESQERLLDRFYGALRSGGYLVLGRSERLALRDERPFITVDGRERIYRKA